MRTTLLVSTIGLVTVALDTSPAAAQTSPTGLPALENSDTNGDWERDLSDAVYLLRYLFAGGPAPVPMVPCVGELPGLRNGDANGDGAIDVSDPVRLLAWLYTGAPAPIPACGEDAGAGASPGGAVGGGGGTYFIEPGIRTELQMSSSHVQCKIGHAVLPDGTGFQMLMFSTTVESTSIDSAAKTADITGSMVSIVRLRFANGAAVTLTETVPYHAHGADNGTPGAGLDFFSLTVLYADTPGLDQFDLFGSPATFAGILVTGDLTVN